MTWLHHRVPLKKKEKMPLTFKEYIQNDLYEYLLAHPEEAISICSELTEGQPIPRPQKEMMTKIIMLFMDKTYRVYDDNFRNSWNISDFNYEFKAGYKRAVELKNKLKLLEYK